MTKKLEEYFDLETPETTSHTDPQTTQAVFDADELTNTLALASKIDAALPSIRDLATNEKEMDELADNATAAFQDLLDLGMQTDPRFSGQVLQVASNMIGHAITARNAKIDNKLRIIDLQLKKLRLDQQREKGKSSSEDDIPGTGQVLDRNELIKDVLNSLNSNNKG
jgi:hypothetical protein